MTEKTNLERKIDLLIGCVQDLKEKVRVTQDENVLVTSGLVRKN